MHNYVKLSLETHLFFARIMKEHALFLEAGVPCHNDEWTCTADRLKQQFEDLLHDVVVLADGNISSVILPLLADHVLREANHYIRILEQAKEKD